MEAFIGQIMGFGGNFAPRGWALCNGQLLPISSYTSLFSIIGTFYGGDGRSTFGLPDLRGRTMINWGRGAGLSDFRIGQTGGREAFTLTVPQMPSHTHAATLHGETAAPDASNPQDKMLALTQIYANPIATDDRTMASESIRVPNTGGGQPVYHVSPFQAISIIIALEGIYPPRS